MGVGQTALAADAGAHRRVEHGGQGVQCGAGAGNHHTAAADQHGRACGHQALGSFVHGSWVGGGAVGREVVVPWLGPHVALVDGVLLHVVGQADVRGTGAAGGHGAEGAAHGVGNLVHAVNGGVPFGQRLVQGLLVQLG